MMQPERDAEDRFVREWKEWLERPPLKPAATAASQITAAIRGQAEARRPRWPVLAAATALVCVAAISVVMIHRIPPAAPTSNVLREASPPLGDGEVLIWLDEHTPLYMTFQAPDSWPGSGGKR
jgi:hypothetical protein